MYKEIKKAKAELDNLKKEFVLGKLKDVSKIRKQKKLVARLITKMKLNRK
mgnify:CR=1 FL=1